MGTMSNGGIGGGVSSAVARAVGADRQADADALLLHTVIVALAFGLAFTLGTIFLAPRLYSSLGGHGQTLEFALTNSAWVFGGLDPQPTGIGHARGRGGKDSGYCELGGRGGSDSALVDPDIRTWPLSTPGCGRRRRCDFDLLRRRLGSVFKTPRGYPPAWSLPPCAAMNMATADRQ
jgi:hypothetical protein